MANPVSLLLVLLIVPLAWSGLIQMVRSLAGRKSAVFHDLTEKAVMAVMLLPSLVGVIFLTVAPLLAPLNRSHVFYPPVFDEVAEVAVKALPRLAPQGPDLTALGAQVILGLYVVGLGFTLWRLWRSHSWLVQIVRTARPTGADQKFCVLSFHLWPSHGAHDASSCRLCCLSAFRPESLISSSPMNARIKGEATPTIS